MEYIEILSTALIFYFLGRASRGGGAIDVDKAEKIYKRLQRDIQRPFRPHDKPGPVRQLTPDEMAERNTVKGQEMGVMRQLFDKILK